MVPSLEVGIFCKTMFILILLRRDLGFPKTPKKTELDHFMFGSIKRHLDINLCLSHGIYDLFRSNNYSDRVSNIHFREEIMATIVSELTQFI